MGTPNYSKLVASGRLKAPGVAWTPEEWKALQDGVPVDLVRRGVLSEEAAEEQLEFDKKHEEETGLKPVDALDRTELAKKARELGVEFTPVTTDVQLVEMIKEALEEGVKEDKKEAPKKKAAKKTSKK